MMTIAVAFIFFGLVALSVPMAIGLGVAAAAVMAWVSPFPLSTVFQRMIAGMDSFVLSAIPLYILTANLMNAGGITDRLFLFVRRLVGHFPGGLAHANVGANMVFAGISGSAVADAGGLGNVMIRAMREQGYRAEMAAGLSAAASVIGPIIPPSIPFVIYGAMAEVSVGKLFAAGVLPGIAIGLAMAVFIAATSKRNGYPRDRRATLHEILRSFRESILALLTPVIIVGGILGGIFTPTEAAAVAVVYAFVISMFAYRVIRWKDVPEILIESMVTSSIVLFMIATVSSVSWLMTVEQAGPAFVAALKAVSREPWIILLLINAGLLVLGCLVESGAILILMTPILLPLITSLGIDPVHFGVVIVLNLMIGVATPPVGMSLFVVAHVARIPLDGVMRAVLPFLVPLLVVLVLVTFVPSLSLWLPSLLFH
ncbi:MAG: TRAP transporter large permease [Acidobacteriota bacterium]